MTVRVRTKVVVIASLDSDENQTQFARPDTSLSEIIETFDVECSGELELAASEADYALPMGKVASGQLLYIETSGDLTVKLDGEVTGHALRRPSGAKAKLLMRSEFATAPTVSNGDATNVVTLSYFIAGAK